MEYNVFVDKISKNLFNIDSKGSSCVDFLSSCYKSLSLDSKNAIPFLPSNLDSEQIWQIVNIQNSQNNELLESTSTLLQNSKYQSLYKIATKQDEEEDSNIDGEELSNEMSEDEPEEVAEIKQKKPKTNKQKGKSSEVDDDFFKLSEMEAFLDHEEKEDSTKQISDINYFEDIPDEEDNDDELNYNNFYEDQDESEGDEENSEIEEAKPLSTFEVREERLKTQMKQLEEEIVAKKSWQLRGETNSKNRPVNSLLEEVLEFDSTSRAPLIITESTSEKLEDIIVNRIKNSLFDDVVKKIVNKEKPEYTKQIVLDQEKSKESLSAIYEKQFNNQLDTNPEETITTNKQFSSLMYSLFTKLDSLSNYHVTPQRLQEEPRIITNTLSLQVEEVAPVSVSDRNTLAPEEVKVRKQNVLGNSEKTKSAKKKHRKMKAIKYKSKTLDTKAANPKVSKSESNSAIKTSTSFFSELQSNRVNLKNKKPMPQANSSKKVKL
ncbi:MPHOSPH10 family protein [Megaselia abdita]